MGFARSVASCVAIFISAAPAAAADLAVIEKAAEYAGAIGCGPDEGWEGDFAVQLSEGNDDSWTPSRHLVFAYTDVGCQGGTGTSWFIPVLVERVGGWRTYVNVEESFPVIDVSGVNSRTISSVEMADQNSITVEWRDYADGDENCCPSIPVETTLVRDQLGNWQPY